MLTDKVWNLKEKLTCEFSRCLMTDGGLDHDDRGVLKWRLGFVLLNSVRRPETYSSSRATCTLSDPNSLLCTYDEMYL